MLILQKKSGIGHGNIYVAAGTKVQQYNYDLNLTGETGTLAGTSASIQVGVTGDAYITVAFAPFSVYKIDKDTMNVTPVGTGQVVQNRPGAFAVDDTYYYPDDTRRFLSNGNLDYQFGVNEDRIKAVYSDGSVAFAGDSTGGDRIRKYNASGVFQWEFVDYMGDLWHSSRDMRTDAAGNLYVVGRLGSFSTPTILRLDVNGANPLVLQPATGSWFRTIGYDNSGNIYVGERDEYLSKFNSSGVLQWRESIGVSSDDIESLVVLPSTGDTYALVDAIDSNYIRKFNTDGQLVKSIAIDGNGQDIGIKEFPVTT